MTGPDQVNPAVAETVAIGTTASIGAAPSAAMAATYATMADSMGIVMMNAARCQQAMQPILVTNTAVTCAWIITKATA